jgi:twitching motility protein PilT
MPALDRYFDVLLEQGGSDLHLSIGYPPMIRAKGELVPIEDGPLDHPTVVRLMDEIINEDKRVYFHAHRDLDFAYGYEDKARFRANYLYKTTGPGAVFRTIPSEILTAEQLGLPKAAIDLAERRSGLVLVTGPTGSGKSTTLAAMLDHINRNREGHILTIEDPVEFVHTPKQCQITHREVGDHTPSFADAIRSAGRENADVILVGELRGRETMQMALQLASFGILIFATVHTNSAPATIDRFVNAFPANQQPQIRGMLADSLAGIVAQQLLRKADRTGRVAAQEILIGTSGVAAAIREAKTSMLTSLIQSGGTYGMQSIDAVLAKLVEAGTVTPEDALDKAADKDSFARIPKVAAALKSKT